MENQEENNNEKVERIKKALMMLNLQLKPLKKIETDKKYNMISSEVYPVAKAKGDAYDAKKQKFIVTTIKWSFTKNEDGTPNLDEVHKNKYEMTLAELFQFKKEKKKVPEDIISIEVKI